MGVDWHFLWDIVGATRIADADAVAGAAFAGDWVVGVGAGGEGSAALEVFVDYVLRGIVHVLVIYRANRANRANRHFVCKDSVGR